MFSFLKGNNKESPKRAYVWILLLGAIIGVALLFLGNREATPSADAQAPVYDLSRDEVIIYQSYLEERVKALCSSVDGVGNVSVIVTLEGGFSSEYAVEYKDGNEEYVIVGSGSSQSGLFLTRSIPKISGVGVVCHGGTNPKIQKELTALLSAALDLPSNRIYVTAAKSS